MESSVMHHRFTVDQLERMVAVGILHEDDRVELIDGEIVQMAAQGAKHINTVNRLTTFLVRTLGGHGIVSVQNAVRLRDDTEPQPDLAVLREDFPEDVVPTAADALFVIEVCDSSLYYDRTVKLPRYAQAGIPEAWLVDVDGEHIERHTDPGKTGYRFVAIAERGDTLASTVLPEIQLSVDAVLGQRRS